MTPITKPGEADLTAAVRSIIELYADSYATMTRIAALEGRDDVVHARSVEVDLRQNILPALLAALGTTPATPVPASEPVAWMLEWVHSGEVRAQRLYDDERHCRLDAESDGGVCVPLARALSTPTSPAPAPATQAGTQGEAP